MTTSTRPVWPLETWLKFQHPRVGEAADRSSYPRGGARSSRLPPRSGRSSWLAGPAAGARPVRVQDVGTLDRHGVGQPAAHVLDQVLKVNLGAARAERVRREQVALADLRDACVSQTAEPAEDRSRVLLGGDRQRRRVAVYEGPGGGF